MDVQARAGIDLYGRVLRYAEVERRANRYQLMRLGSCEFDFDVPGAIFEAADTEPLQALAEALGDVFEGSAATRLHVALHPPRCYSFFTPLPADVPREERKRRLLDEAALVTRTGAPQPLRLTADPVHTEAMDEGAAVEWYHVLALREQVHARFDRMLRLLPHPRHRMTLSMHAVANAVERIERRRGAEGRRDRPFSLALGWYPTHIEYTLARDARWYFSHYTDACDPGDTGYFILDLFHHLGLAIGSLGHIFIYGGYRSSDAFASLEGIFGVVPERLNPLQLIDLDPNSMAAGDRLDAFAPCLGVVL